MGEDELIVLIVFGSIFGIVVVSQLISLAKKWIDRTNSSYDEEAFDRLAKAFIQHKKDTRRRLQNLEAIIPDEGGKSTAASSKKQLDKAKSHEKIEIDSNDSESQEENRESSSRGGNLKNMLNKSGGSS